MLLILGSIQGVYAQRTEKSKKFMVDKTLFEELTDVKRNRINSTFTSICKEDLMQTSETDSKKGLSK